VPSAPPARPRPALVVARLAVVVGASALLAAGCAGRAQPGDDPTVGDADVTATPSAAPTDAAVTPTAEPTAVATAEPQPVTATPDGAVPVLTSATLVNGRVEMSGFVQGLIVDGVECRFELDTPSGVVHTSSISTADATATLCPGVSVLAPAGQPGSWSARLVWVRSGAVSSPVAVTVD